MNNPRFGKIKYSINHKCGHTRMVPMFEGKSVDTWTADLEATDCPKCWLAKQPPTFHLRTSPVGLAIDVSRGFTLRENLRLRGYRFSRPHWRIWFKRESDRAAEVRWLLSQGAQESRAEEAGAA
jgi:hypothetical protein